MDFRQLVEQAYFNARRKQTYGHMYAEVSLSKKDMDFVFDGMRKEKTKITSVQEYIYLNGIEPLFFFGIHIRIVP